MAIEFRCSGCAELFVVAEVTAGRKGKCPKCAAVNVVPRPIPAVLSAPANGTAVAEAAPSTMTDAPPAPTDVEQPKPTEPAPVKWVPPPKRKPRRRVPWLLIAALVAILAIGLAIGGYFLFSHLYPMGLGREPIGKRAGSR